jgi:hypothetical protein
LKKNEISKLYEEWKNSPPSKKPKPLLYVRAFKKKLKEKEQKKKMQKKGSSP